VVILLKIILICRYSRTHLEARIAELIRYYQSFSIEECAWVVNFFEVFNVTFTIYAENVRYNLIKMEREGEPQPACRFDPDHYRIFSQLKANEGALEVLELFEPDLPLAE
jgi:hypothetical protein